MDYTFDFFSDRVHVLLGHNMTYPDAPSSLSPKGRVKYLAPLIQSMALTLRYRYFITTRNGRLGVGPYGTKPGDKCVIVVGSDVPMVLRQDDEHCRLIGNAYVDSAMDSELITMNRRLFVNSGPTQDFVLQ
jgi:hypothetical protein